ncbi:MAG: TDP-N-acetylfucosamine:lipid II N-acetylfucosaminyltransferase [Bacteroidota bacterium]|nr:TDP-N-acetylfucosamine:lipid II N-acetylfucosaminyltransferase [Bacteroidota bacterium]
MILHLAEDEKFIDVVIKEFENSVPNESIYLINVPDLKYELKYIHNIDIVKCFPYKSEEYKYFINDLKSYDAVILHNFYTSYKWQIVLTAPFGVNFHWMCWGADLYSLPTLYNKFLLPKTKNTVQSLNSPAPYSIRKSLNKLINRIALKRISSVSTVLPYEYELIKRYISNSIKYYSFKYGYIELLTKGILNYDFGNDILLGNSASFTNNHIDTLYYLKEIGVRQNLVTPLSYGNTNYAKLVNKLGNQLFSNQFKPLVDFLPLEKYNEILKSCGNVIMNNLRQEGMGNIIISLWAGKRVFLNKNSPVYSYFKNNSLVVFKIEELNQLEQLPNFKELAIVNRPIIEKLYSYNTVIDEVKKLINELKGVKNQKKPFLHYSKNRNELS